MESGDTLYFAIVPDNFNNLPDSRYELFLVNDTQQTCLYSIAFRHGENIAVSVPVIVIRTALVR